VSDPLQKGEFFSGYFDHLFIIGANDFQSYLFVVGPTESMKNLAHAPLTESLFYVVSIF
jgi:hypothetical protein